VCYAVSLTSQEGQYSKTAKDLSLGLRLSPKNCVDSPNQLSDTFFKVSYHSICTESEMGVLEGRQAVNHTARSGQENLSRYAGFQGKIVRISVTKRRCNEQFPYQE
jgi:hypothetical protein